MPGPFQPGLVTPGAAAELARMRAELARVSAQLDRLVLPTDDFFPARLTGGTGPYAWTERAFDATGARYDKPGGRTGTVSPSVYQPAYEPNGLPVPAAATEVWLRRRVVTPTAGPTYEIVGGAGNGGLTVRGLDQTTAGLVTKVPVTYLDLQEPAYLSDTSALGDGTFKVNIDVYGASRQEAGVLLGYNVSAPGANSTDPYRQVTKNQWGRGGFTGFDQLGTGVVYLSDAAGPTTLAGHGTLPDDAAFDTWRVSYGYVSGTVSGGPKGHLGVASGGSSNYLQVDGSSSVANPTLRVGATVLASGQFAGAFFNVLNSRFDAADAFGVSGQATVDVRSNLYVKNAAGSQNFAKVAPFEFMLDANPGGASDSYVRGWLSGGTYKIELNTTELYNIGSTLFQRPGAGGNKIWDGAAYQVGGTATVNGLQFLCGWYVGGSISGLSVSQGGTGAGTLTSGAFLVGAGTGAIAGAANLQLGGVGTDEPRVQPTSGKWTGSNVGTFSSVATPGITYATSLAGAPARTHYLPLGKLDATAAPGATDDSSKGYVGGSLWVDTTLKRVHVCTDNTAGAAVWVRIA